MWAQKVPTSIFILHLRNLDSYKEKKLLGMAQVAHTNLHFPESHLELTLSFALWVEVMEEAMRGPFQVNPCP